VLKQEVERRCWGINLTKTVLLINYYDTLTPAKLTAQATEIDMLLPYADANGRRIPVETDGTVFLGTPTRAERDDRYCSGTLGARGRHAQPPTPAGWSAPLPCLPVSQTCYRTTKLEGFIDDHNERPRRIVELSHRDAITNSALLSHNINKMLAMALLKWSCNSRDVHLIFINGVGQRSCGKRLCGKFAIKGIVTLPPHTTTVADGTVTTNYMPAQPDSVYSHGYNLSYAHAA
jgi:hypothetical protein